MVAKIRKLPDDVIIRIAAGEILIRPINAVKELIENALDACARQIIVSVTDGGMRGLVVSDDGCGIDRDDLALLCERHATSKLSEFDDLYRMQTFGFRGEALASISVVGRLTVVTRTVDSQNAWKARYLNNNMDGPIEPAASNVGTIFTIDDLFYSLPERRKIFLHKSADEHARIFDLLCKYAICNAGKVGFILKRNGKPNPDITTSLSMDHAQVVSSIYGSELAENTCHLSDRTTLELPCSGSADVRTLALDLEMLHSNTYYRRKEPVIIIFVNKRLVDWPLLSRSVKSIYSQIILSGWHPWFYVSISLPPNKVDVNVSCTKHTVTISNAEDVVSHITNLLDRSLKQSAKSRLTSPLSATSITLSPISSSQSSSIKIAPYKRIYSDHTATKIDHYFSPPSKEDTKLSTDALPPRSQSRPFEPRRANDRNAAANTGTADPPIDKFILTETSPIRSGAEDSETPSLWGLESIQKLCTEMQGRKSEEVSRVIKKHVMVGCACSCEKTFIQYETFLFITDTRAFAFEYFRSEILSGIGRIKKAQLSSPTSLEHLLRDSIDSGKIILDGNIDQKRLVFDISQLLLGKCRFLEDLFSIVICIEDATLKCVPGLMNAGQVPVNGLLGVLLFRLGAEIKWGQDEETIIGGICHEIAAIYSHLPFEETKENEDYVKNKLYPAFKRSQHGFPSSLAKDGCIQIVSDLHTLYKQFDRC